MDNHQYTVAVDQRGRLVLPADLRQQLGIQRGSKVILTIHEEEIRLTSAAEIARKGRGLLRTMAPEGVKDRQLAEEMIAERRHAADQE